MEQRRMIMHVDWVFHGMVEVVRGAARQITFDSATRHLHRERLRMMVASIVVLCGGGSSKLSTP